MTDEHIHDKFAHILGVIKSPKFLTMEALGGEIPFWISAYNPTQENEVNNEIGHLVRKLKNDGIEVQLVNLFRMSMELADRHLGLERLFETERRKDKEKFKKALQSTINIHERLIPAIKAEIESSKPDLLLINGVGAVFPFIRSHNVLNNLQSAVKEIPTIMFFPGRYTGQSLELFGLLKDDNYYRAFNIDQYKV